MRVVLAACRQRLRGITGEQVARVLEALLIAVIVVCVVIIVIALLKNHPPSARPTSTNYPTTRFTVTPGPRPTPYYKNCAEAHADGRWDIREGDPA